jgi:uncharacterized phage-associated protein
MARSSLDLAKHILFLLKQKEYSISNTKVQKVLYCYLGFGLAQKRIEKDNIIDELPNAWDRGPVFPKVFKMIKKNEEACKNIEILAEDITSKLQEKEKEILIKTVEAVGRHDANKLSTWTHLKDSPWDIVYNLQNAKYSKIPLELIKEYFEEDVKDLDEKDGSSI